ncbi:hypothetical protein [Spirosoma flavus]
MKQSVQNSKRSNAFGLLASAFALIGWAVPIEFLFRLLILVAACAIIGLASDRTKLFSGLAIGMGLLLYFTRYRYDLGADDLDKQRYEVRYEVDCQDCSVRFTNSSGGVDEEKGVHGGWSKVIEAPGNLLIDLTAQPNGANPTASVRLFVNGVYMAGEHSSGRYLAAFASCRPRDYYDKR